MRTFYGIYCISSLDAGLRGKTANVVYNDHLQYNNWVSHYSDIIVGTKRLKSPASWLFTEPFIETQIKEKNQSYASLAFVRGMDRWPASSPHKWPVTQKMFPFDDVIKNSDVSMVIRRLYCYHIKLHWDYKAWKMKNGRHSVLHDGTKNKTTYGLANSDHLVERKRYVERWRKSTVKWLDNL